MSNHPANSNQGCQYICRKLGRCGEKDKLVSLTITEIIS